MCLNPTMTLSCAASHNIAPVSLCDLHWQGAKFHSGERSPGLEICGSRLYKVPLWEWMLIYNLNDNMKKLQGQNKSIPSDECIMKFLRITENV